MRARLRTLVIGSALGLASLAACGGAGPAARPPPLVLERTIPLQGVAGRIDHLAIDVKHQRLFVAELGNGTVDAIDLTGEAPSGRIGGLKTPQGLAYLPDRDELAVASGGEGTVRFYRGGDLAPLAQMNVGDDADNLRVDPRSGQLVVGYGAGALALIDPGSRKVIRTLALPAHPEGFRLDGDRVFINVPDARAVVVGDLAAGRITAIWTAAHRWNFPMAYDGATDLLAVVYRLPSRLVILDPVSGQGRADLSTCGDADDVFFDAKRRRLYVACGSGAVDVIQASPSGYGRLARIATRPGARTALFVPELDRLFIAARAGGPGSEAAILVYRPS